MIISKKQLKCISQKEREDLFEVLCSMEDTLGYKCRNITKAIDYIRENYYEITVNKIMWVRLVKDYIKYKINTIKKYGGNNVSDLDKLYKLNKSEIKAIAFDVERAVSSEVIETVINAVYSHIDKKGEKINDK